jgi:hypothetical protein
MPETATNRRFYEGPDVETLNILIELGEIVAHSEPIVWDIVPADTESTRTALLTAAADAILGLKALRAHRIRAKRLSEPERAHKGYDFRLPVFPGGDAA